MTSRFDGHYKNQNVTPNDVPDPEVMPEIPGPILLVRPRAAEDKIKTASGFELHLPDQYIDDAKFLTNVGQVKVVGDMAYEESRKGDNRFGRKMWCKEGDWVVWRKHGGHKIVYKGVIYVVLMDDEIVMKIPDPNAIDVNANTVRT